MSLPTFPVVSPPLTTDDSLNMILASIAAEELGLSHIINAEGEKIQYVLGTLHKCQGTKASVEDILAVNKSVKCLLDSVMQNQVILKSKMECAVCALKENSSGTTGAPGPTGPTGPTGPSGGSETCGAISFPGCPGQCWNSGTPLMWSCSECSKCCPMHLAPDHKRIILGPCRCYVVSFSMNLCVSQQNCKNVCISVQTAERMKKTDNFICHVPIVHKDVPFTASAGGVFISTHNCPSSTELMLTLLSPSSVKVLQSSICVMEI